MDQTLWINSVEAIQKSKRYYAHFDLRTDLQKAKSYVVNPISVSKHGFYPLIHYTQKFQKYSKEKGKKEKSREICYAAHLDRCIYQYYAHLINEKYNKRVREDDISNVAVAYRSDLKKSNIHFAYEAISFIRKNGSCFVMIGDFTHFFESLDHQYLKKQLCNLLQTERLPDDYYAVFKSITHYSTWELADLLLLNGLKNTKSGIHQLNKKPCVLSLQAFHEYKKQYITPHKEPYGIPQGSPISALFANIYMLTADREIHEYVKRLNGFYMRYSDDFCVVLPALCLQEAQSAFYHIKEILKSVPRLVLQPEKTQYFKCADADVENYGAQFSEGADCKHRFINFLGFTYSGKTVKIRDKTVSKYYYRMYKKAKTIIRQRKSGLNPSKENLYRIYSCKGETVGRGNFLTYVRRAQKEFGAEDSISNSTKRHMQKIKRILSQ